MKTYDKIRVMRTLDGAYYTRDYDHRKAMSIAKKAKDDMLKCANQIAKSGAMLDGLLEDAYKSGNKDEYRELDAMTTDLRRQIDRIMNSI